MAWSSTANFTPLLTEIPSQLKMFPKSWSPGQPDIIGHSFNVQQLTMETFFLFLSSNVRIDTYSFG